jgi:hypothetical protein
MFLCCGPTSSTSRPLTASTTSFVRTNAFRVPSCAHGSLLPARVERKGMANALLCSYMYLTSSEPANAQPFE